MAREIEYSLAMSEAFYVAIEALRSEAHGLKTSVQREVEEGKIKDGESVHAICLSKIEEQFQAADLLEGSLKRLGHRDFLRRQREKGNRTYMVP